MSGLSIRSPNIISPPSSSTPKPLLISAGKENIPTSSFNSKASPSPKNESKHENPLDPSNIRSVLLNSLFIYFKKALQMVQWRWSLKLRTHYLSIKVSMKFLFLKEILLILVPKKPNTLKGKRDNPSMSFLILQIGICQKLKSIIRLLFVAMKD